MESGVTAKLYGPWLCAKDKESILFVNLAVDSSERQMLIATMKNFSHSQGKSSNNFLIGESLRDGGIDEKADAT